MPSPALPLECASFVALLLSIANRFLLVRGRPRPQMNWSAGALTRTPKILIHNQTVELKEIQHGTPEYDRAVQLRREVLRWPLGLEYTAEQLAEESTQRHFVGECGMTGQLEYLCSATMHEEEPGVARIRQVAVRADSQGKGLGAELMLFVEQKAREAGFTQSLLCSRHYAIPFYEKLGYVCVSDWFEEVGMPHRTMVKSL